MMIVTLTGKMGPVRREFNLSRKKLANDFSWAIVNAEIRLKLSPELAHSGEKK